MEWLVRAESAQIPKRSVNGHRAQSATSETIQKNFFYTFVNIAIFQICSSM